MICYLCCLFKYNVSSQQSVSMLSSLSRRYLFGMTLVTSNAIQTSSEIIWIPLLFLFYLTFTSLFIPLFLSKVCSFFFSLFHSLQIKRSKSCTTKYWFVEPSVDRSARLSGYKRKADSSLIPPYFLLLFVFNEDGGGEYCC